MNKIFLYLYPIEEYAKTFFHGNEYYDSQNQKRPFDVLNKTIQKRYREKGYQVVFAIYPDREIFGIIPHEKDRVIQTDITFKDASGYYDDGREKTNEAIKYPSEQFLINQLGYIDKLVVGGYHYGSCVKSLAEIALDNGIDALVDLDMTDLFFSLYGQTDYFNEEEYNPEDFKKFMIEDIASLFDENYAESFFNTEYSSLAYGFNKNTTKRIK